MARETWSPARITGVDIGAVFFGLTLYEISESVEVRYVDGKYVRLSEDPLSTKGRRPRASDWTTNRDMPSGRLALRCRLCLPSDSSS